MVRGGFLVEKRLFQSFSVNTFSLSLSSCHCLCPPPAHSCFSLSFSLLLTQGMWCISCQQGGSTTSSASLPTWPSSRPWPRPLAPPLSLCCLLRPPAPPLPPQASAFRLLLTRVRHLAFLLTYPLLALVFPSVSWAPVCPACLWCCFPLPVSVCCPLLPLDFFHLLGLFLPSPQCSFLLQCHQPW